MSAGRAFPSAYRDWLRAFGARAGSFGRRRSMFWPAALEIQTGLQNVLEHHGIAFRPEPEMFIFGVEAIPGETPFHFHYRIDYFRRPEGDDPPVYRYDSEEGTTRRVQDSISGFLTGELERQIAGKISPTKE
ncbi:MAG: SMI1/KNR4 family protein [Armatimonadetes bacterium]|nr:SMI1/KNR4 family protein [Armatimonadota bacterium]